MKQRYQLYIFMPQNASDRVSENLDFDFFQEGCHRAPIEAKISRFFTFSLEAIEPAVA